MMSLFKKRSIFVIVFMCLLVGGIVAQAQSTNQTQYIYDNAGVLTAEEEEQLEDLASTLSAARNTAFIILTVDGTGGKSITEYMGDFYDDEAPGYDKPHGNTAMLTIDFQERDVYLSAFKEAQEYLDNDRLETIRLDITYDLTDGYYYDAFSDFMYAAYDYMGYPPGELNPDSFFFQWWFQLAVSLVVAWLVLRKMISNSGGVVTVNGSTYIDRRQSGVVERQDNYLRTTVTQVKKPDNSDSGGGGGGGTTSDGHSYSGSGGKF